MSTFAVFHTSSRSYLLPSKSHTASYARFAEGGLSAFSKSLYSKRPYDKTCHILYKASCSVASQLSQLPHVTDFVGQSRRSPHRFTLCVSGCGSLPAHIRILAVFHTAPCSSMLASFKHAVVCACFACPKTARLTTALYSKKERGHRPHSRHFK